MTRMKPQIIHREWVSNSTIKYFTVAFEWFTIKFDVDLFHKNKFTERDIIEHAKTLMKSAL